MREIRIEIFNKSENWGITTKSRGFLENCSVAIPVSTVDCAKGVATITLLTSFFVNLMRRNCLRSDTCLEVQ